LLRAKVEDSRLLERWAKIVKKAVPREAALAGKWAQISSLLFLPAPSNREISKK
jgi:hypothetical protein